MYDLYGALIGNLSNYLYTYILIILLVAGGIYFTVRTKFVQFRYLKESLRVVLAPSEDDKAISSFQALMVSTASRVGTGCFRRFHDAFPGSLHGSGCYSGNRKYRRRIHSNLSRRTRIIILDVAHSASGNVYCFRGGNSGSDLQAPFR